MSDDPGGSAVRRDRFSGGPARGFLSSLADDARIFEADLAVDRAHVVMLAEQGIVEPGVAGEILGALDEVESAGHEALPAGEDVHEAIETAVIERVGEEGGRMHTARSRNDEVAACLRWRLREDLLDAAETTVRLREVLAGVAAEHTETVMPGYTHLQPAQPVSLAQHLLAYAQMFMRDHERCADALKRVQVSPLGAGALAGTTFPVEPKFSASQVGFPESFANSMDAVSDRDFAAEALFTAALAAMHLSRLCEEIILWANPGFGFVTLPDAFATGSSIMPQKKNPDAAEIMRGKTGRVYGNLVSLLTTLKGLPLTYNRDLQEDKEPFFDSDRTMRACLSIMAAMLGELEFETEAMREALSEGFLNATELADYLVARGMPFREAHHAAGQAVALAEARDVELDELSLSDLQKIAEEIEDDVFDALDYETAVSRRNAPGGTGPRSVVAQLDAVGAWLAKNGGQNA
jgi:argininosuccinate lyase